MLDPPAVSGTYRTNDGVGLHYEQAGEGRPLIMIPGATASIEWFKRNFGPLSRELHVVALDMRGFGRSEPSPWGQSCARYAMDVFGLLQHLNLRDVTLLGWSCGARTIYTYLMLLGNERLRAAVLVDDTVHHSVHDPPLADVVRRPGESEEAHQRRTFRLMVSPTDPQALPESELEWMLAAVGEFPESLHAAGRAQDLRPLCPTIDLPVLLVSGRHSGALPGCRYAAEQIPGARLEVFEESQHVPFYTEADRFNRLVADFVRQ